MFSISMFPLGIVFALLITSAAPNEQSDDLDKVAIPEEAQERDAAYRQTGGIPKKLAYFVGEELVGERRFYGNGNLAEEKHYRNGNLHGYWRQYHENGRLFAERPYRDGKPDGTFRFYGKDGTLLGESSLSDGTGKLREFPFLRIGSHDAVIPYVNGKVEGIKRVWGRYRRPSPDGLREEAFDGVNLQEYRDGKPNGWGTTYDTQGRLFSCAYMQDGTAHGVFRKYDAEGRNLNGWPKYFIHGKEVPRDQYVRAAETDRALRESLSKDRPDEAPDLRRPEP